MDALAVEDRIFLETTRRFAPPRLAREDVRIALQLAQVEPGKPLADLGCGFGRHLRALQEAGHRQPLGVDRSPLLLQEAIGHAPGAALVRADLRALPLHASSLSAAFCFYSSMFLGSDADALRCLVEAARVLREGGSLVLTTDNPLRLSPRSRFEEDVPGLGRIVEESEFDGTVDRVTKTLVPPGGQKLSATFSIRYYAPAALAALGRKAGLTLRSAELTRESPQLVAHLEKVP